uniref:TNFR-Cys domain-containing protein n=1 Tax=Panagrolaimus sp. PS1159 TaxID=55785 RepID=A0AC35FZK6_9BILA
MLSIITVIFVCLTAVAITAGNPLKCENGQFLDETFQKCVICDFRCSSCKSFGINVIENGCICKTNVYKNETSIFCAIECPPEIPSKDECIKASEFNFQNATDTFSPLQTANDVQWLFIIAAILACCCFCCAG